MTRPRSQLVTPGAEGAFHCVQRCVRRAFLCGIDRYTGQSFEHRKDWVETRILLVGECFAVAIHAYAIMSNHLHLVLQIDPNVVAEWSDDEVASRWLRLFPPHEETEAAFEFKRQRVLADADRVVTIRAGLQTCPGSCAVSSSPSRAVRTAKTTARGGSGKDDTSAKCSATSVRCLLRWRMSI